MALRLDTMSDINRSIVEAQALRYLIDALKDKDAIDLLLPNNQLDMSLFHIAQLCEKSTKACLAMKSLLISDNKLKNADRPIKEHLFSDLVKTRLMPISDNFQDDFR
jgi:hypothetical protein